MIIHCKNQLPAEEKILLQAAFSFLDWVVQREVNFRFT